MLAGYANKYMDNFDSSQTLIYNETMSFNPVPENLKKGKILDPYWRELPAEQDKYICLNQDKALSNLQQRIAFVYGPLTKFLPWMDAAKESYVADEGGNNLFEISKLFDQVILLLGQAIKLCSCIRRLMSWCSLLGTRKV